MSKLLKAHYQNKPRGFKALRAEATFVIRIQDGDRHHLFTVKMMPDCSFHTYFQAQSKISKELASAAVATVDLSIMLLCERPARLLGHAQDVSLKHPLSPSRIEGIQATVSSKRDFSIADMEAFNRRVSGE